MSKRKAKPQVQNKKVLSHIDQFRFANQQIVTINVSLPILRIVEALVNNQDFRDKTIKLMLDKKL